MVDAIRVVVEVERVIAEPAGAATLAAATKIRDRLQGKNVIVMVTGGNIDPETLHKYIQS